MFREKNSAHALDRSQTVVRGQMRIAHHHAQAAVSKQFGNGSQIRSAHHKAGGKRVPDIVPVEIADASRFHGTLEPAAWVLVSGTFCYPCLGTDRAIDLRSWHHDELRQIAEMGFAVLNAEVGAN